MNSIKQMAIFYLLLGTISTFAMDQNDAQRNTPHQQRSVIAMSTTVTGQIDEQYHINIAFGYDDDSSDDESSDNSLHNGNASVHNPTTETAHQRLIKRVRFSESSSDNDSSSDDDSDIERMLNN